MAYPVTGKIRDSSTGLGVPGALVELTGVGSIYTDWEGKFNFYNVPGGTYSINVIKDGYEPILPRSIIVPYYFYTIDLTPTPIIEYPKIINGWEAYDAWEEHLLTDFGSRETISDYLSDKTKTQILKWYNDWVKMFWDAQQDVPTRTIYDRMQPIVKEFYYEYYPYAPD